MHQALASTFRGPEGRLSRELVGFVFHFVISCVSLDITAGTPIHLVLMIGHVEMSDFVGDGELPTTFIPELIVNKNARFASLLEKVTIGIERLFENVNLQLAGYIEHVHRAGKL